MICERESITAETDALAAIARAAEGSVRDALSLLDQAAAMAADKLTNNLVADMWGKPSQRLTYHTFRSIEWRLCGRARHFWDRL